MTENARARWATVFLAAAGIVCGAAGKTVADRLAQENRAAEVTARVSVLERGVQDYARRDVQESRFVAIEQRMGRMEESQKENQRLLIEILGELRKAKR